MRGKGNLDLKEGRGEEETKWRMRKKVEERSEERGMSKHLKRTKGNTRVMQEGMLKRQTETGERQRKTGRKGEEEKGY